MQEAHAFQADCINELVEPWGLVRTTLVDWPPSQYDYSYAEDTGTIYCYNAYKVYIPPQSLFLCTQLVKMLMPTSLIRKKSS